MLTDKNNIALYRTVAKHWYSHRVWLERIKKVKNAKSAQENNILIMNQETILSAPECNSQKKS